MTKIRKKKFYINSVIIHQPCHTSSVKRAESVFNKIEKIQKTRINFGLLSI